MNLGFFTFTAIVLTFNYYCQVRFTKFERFGSSLMLVVIYKIPTIVPTYEWIWHACTYLSITFSEVDLHRLCHITPKITAQSRLYSTVQGNRYGLEFWINTRIIFEFQQGSEKIVPFVSSKRIGWFWRFKGYKVQTNVQYNILYILVPIFYNGIKTLEAIIE